MLQAKRGVLASSRLHLSAEDLNASSIRSALATRIEQRPRALKVVDCESDGTDSCAGQSISSVRGRDSH